MYKTALLETRKSDNNLVILYKNNIFLYLVRNITTEFVCVCFFLIKVVCEWCFITLSLVCHFEQFLLAFLAGKVASSVLEQTTFPLKVFRVLSDTD